MLCMRPSDLIRLTTASSYPLTNLFLYTPPFRLWQPLLCCYESDFLFFRFHIWAIPWVGVAMSVFLMSRKLKLTRGRKRAIRSSCHLTLVSSSLLVFTLLWLITLWHVISWIPVSPFATGLQCPRGQESCIRSPPRLPFLHPAPGFVTPTYLRNWGWIESVGGRTHSWFECFEASAWSSATPLPLHGDGRVPGGLLGSTLGER